MTRYLPIKQTIFFRDAAADVVNDEVPFVAVVPVVRDEPDVSHSFSVEVPGNDITGLIVRSIGRDRNRFAPTGKEVLQVGNSPMVDVCVRMIQSPFLRISWKVCGHIFVNFFLQVDASVAKCSDHYISARSGIRRHVAAGIWYDSIVLCVMRRYLDLLVSTFDNVPNRLRGNVIRRRTLERFNWPGRTEWMLKRIARAAGDADRKDNQYKNWSHVSAFPSLTLER